jgi:hypothetical protein
MKRYVHATAGYIARMLAERPDMVDCLSPAGMTAAEAIAELRKLPADSLLPCGHDDCKQCKEDPQ